MAQCLPSMTAPFTPARQAGRAFRPCAPRLLSRLQQQRALQAPLSCQALPELRTAGHVASQATESRMAWLPGLGSFVSAGLAAAAPAYAEDVAAAAAEAAADAPLTLEGILVSFAFTVVIGLLAVVTGGVIYINAKQWFDNRQEQQDRENAAKGIQGLPSSKSSSNKEVEPVVSLKKAGKAKKEKGKGFADFASRR